MNEESTLPFDLRLRRANESLHFQGQATNGIIRLSRYRYSHHLRPKKAHHHVVVVVDTTARAAKSHLLLFRRPFIVSAINQQL